MAVSNRDRIGKGLELLGKGLRPFVERELKSHLGERWESAGRDVQRGAAVKVNWNDPQLLLNVLCEHWGAVFKNTLGNSERNLAFELRNVRNDWAHHSNQFATNDA